MTRLISSLSEIADDFDAFLVDIWGVLHDGTRAYDGAIDCLQDLQAREKEVVIVSNAARRERAIAQELARVGFHASLYQGIAGSGELTWRALVEPPNPRKKYCYYLGPERSVGILDGLPVTRTRRFKDSDFILNTGAEGNLPHARGFVRLLTSARQHHLPMYCANPDHIAIRNGVAGISAGAIAHEYEKLGGRVIYFGKPHPVIYERCMALLPEVPQHRILAIGDGMPTDIQGGRNAGLVTLLVTGGIHREEVGGSVSHPDLSALTAAYGFQPDLAIDQLRW